MARRVKILSGEWRVRRFVASGFAFLLSGFLLSLIAQPLPVTLAGRWEWRGNIGWQRLILDLKEDRGRLSGTLTMGPGPGDSNNPDVYWEYLFNPVVFELTNVRLQGNTFSFEHTVLIDSQVGEQGYGVPTIIKYVGTVNGDSLTLTRNLQASKSFPLHNRNQRFEVILFRSRSAPQMPTNGDVKVVDQRERRLGFSVTDLDGQFVNSLGRQDFEVYDGGALQKLSDVVGPAASRNFAIVLDLDALLLTPYASSGDVRVAANRAQVTELTLQSLGKGLGTVYRALRSQDRMALDSFTDKLSNVMPWRLGGRTDFASVPIRFDDVFTKGGGTGGLRPEKDVYASIKAAVERFKNIDGERIVILFTDGRDGRFANTEIRNQKSVFAIDPMYGWPNLAEQKEFEQLLGTVRDNHIHFYIYCVNCARSLFDPSSDSRISMMRMHFVPEAADNFASFRATIHSRLEALAAQSGGVLVDVSSVSAAASLMAALPGRLGLGHSYEVTFASVVGDHSDSAPQIRVRDPKLRVQVSE